jgi:hypothetical protein
VVVTTSLSSVVIVMELATCSVSDLALDALKKNKRLGHEVVFKIAVQVLRATVYINEELVSG